MILNLKNIYLTSLSSEFSMALPYCSESVLFMMFFSSTTDTERERHMNVAEYQAICMRNVLHLNEYDDPREELLKERIIDEGMAEGANFICLWNGITCSDGIIRKLEWTHSGHGLLINAMARHKLSLVWLPSTLHRVEISRKKTDGKICTRSLPKDLIELKLTDCLLTGAADLTTLPANLVSIDLSSNNLVGRIDLTELPASLVSADFRLNMVKTVFVINAKLPEALVTFVINGPGCARMYRANFVCADAAKVDMRIS